MRAVRGPSWPSCPSRYIACQRTTALQKSSSTTAGSRLVPSTSRRLRMPSAPITVTTRSLNRIAACICVALRVLPSASGRGGSIATSRCRSARGTASRVWSPPPGSCSGPRVWIPEPTSCSGPRLAAPVADPARPRRIRRSCIRARIADAADASLASTSAGSEPPPQLHRSSEPQRCNSRWTAALPAVRWRRRIAPRSSRPRAGPGRAAITGRSATADAGPDCSSRVACSTE